MKENESPIEFLPVVHEKLKSTLIAAQAPRCFQTFLYHFLTDLGPQDKLNNGKPPDRIQTHKRSTLNPRYFVRNWFFLLRDLPITSPHRWRSRGDKERQRQLCYNNMHQSGTSTICYKTHRNGMSTQHHNLTG